MCTLWGGSQPAPSPSDGPAWGTWIPTVLSLLWPWVVLSALAKAVLLGWMGYPCRKGCFQEGKGSCRRAQHVPTCQTCHLRFTFFFSYQHPYPDRPKTDFSECQRTNSWCAQAERNHIHDVQLFMSRRALHQIQQSGPEIPGISIGNSVLSLTLLSALEGGSWFHRSPQEEGWAHWAHLNVFLGASAVFTLQHWLILGSKQKFLCDTYKTLLLPLPMCIKRKQITIQATNAANY